VKQAVFLVGGRGTRLGNLTIDVPKPLMDIEDKPFLEYLVRNIIRHGFKQLLFLCGYKAEKIQNYFGNGESMGATINYVIEKQLAGTAGAILQATDYLNEEFLLVNGDTLFDLNFLDLVVRKPEGAWIIKMALRKLADASRYGKVEVDGCHVKGFLEKGSIGNGLINGGVYWMKKDIINWIYHVPSSLENDVLPGLVKECMIWGWPYDGLFVDIGIPEALEYARKIVPAWFKRPAAFLDRDGVLNVDKGYVHRREDFTWIEGAKEAVKYLNDSGYLVIVITNQAGVARGYYTEQDVNNLHFWMNEELARIGAHIDDFYYCPHHPEAGNSCYTLKCDCRKPAPGMLLRALNKWYIDKEKSFLVGDTENDLIAAKSVGIKGILFKDANLLEVINQSKNLYEIKKDFLL